MDSTEEAKKVNHQAYEKSKVLKHFWRGWKSEYLAHQLREYHRPNQRNGPTINVGDVVSDKEGKVNRLTWQIRLVEELTMDEMANMSCIRESFQWSWKDPTNPMTIAKAISNRIDISRIGFSARFSGYNSNPEQTCIFSDVCSILSNHAGLGLDPWFRGHWSECGKSISKVTSWSRCHRDGIRSEFQSIFV